MKKFFTLLITILLPLLVFAQNDVKKKAYYFYGETCPHCKNVDAYFQANGIYDKYEITKIEVTGGNPFNQKLFLDFGKAFGESDWGGVPAIVFGDKYLLGDQPIIENFVREIDAAENASELPSPEEISQKTAGESQDNADGSQKNGNVPVIAGNKKSYFPVIIGALVVVGAGALIYVNRKKF